MRALLLIFFTLCSFPVLSEPLAWRHDGAMAFSSTALPDEVKPAREAVAADTASLPGFINILSGSASLTAIDLTVTFNLADLPSSFTINQPWVIEKGWLEYQWGAHIDMDRNGARSAGDLWLFIGHNQYDGAQGASQSATLDSSAFRKILCVYKDSNSCTQDKSEVFFSGSGNSITLRVPISSYAPLQTIGTLPNVTLSASYIAQDGNKRSPDVTVNSTSTPLSPPLCSLTATPSTVPPGSPATLTATCTPAAATYTWSGGTCTGETGPTCTAHPTETTTYTVTGHSPAGPSYPASATVTPFSVATTVVNQTTSAVFTYNPVDIGKTGNIYIFAYLDPNSPLLATSAANSQTASPRTGETVTAPRASNGLVLAVLTRTGWKQAASSGVLEALYTGTLSDSLNTFPLYDKDLFKATQDAGILCAAYTTATGITAKGQGLPLVIGRDASATCPDVTLTAPSYQGLWWNPAESGWGMSITQQGSTAFTALYTYDPLGQPTWYFMSNCPISANGCTGDLYQVSGGSAPTVPWAASVNVTPVGNGQLRFTDADNATFAFSLNGQSGSQSLTRNTFATGSDLPTVDYSDLWWNKTESGWGLSLTQQYNVLFAAWYTYDASGQAVWYVLSDCPLSGNGCTSDLYRVTGGTPLSRPWNAPNKQVTKVGTGTLSFTDRNNGSLSYRIDGVDGKRTLERKPL